jgi:hypothetical protein
MLVGEIGDVAGTCGFEETGLAAGVAYSPEGAARSGMGVDAALSDSSHQRLAKGP